MHSLVTVWTARKQNGSPTAVITFDLGSPELYCTHGVRSEERVFVYSEYWQRRPKYEQDVQMGCFSRIKAYTPLARLQLVNCVLLECTELCTGGANSATVRKCRVCRVCVNRVLPAISCYCTASRGTCQIVADRKVYSWYVFKRLEENRHKWEKEVNERQNTA